MATKKREELAESYNQVKNQLSEIENNKPGEYQGQYSGQVQSLLDKIMNRQEFNYDMNADPLYQQYKGQYTALGQNAMRDTVGNAAGLTGGYASTAAVSAGQQAYNQYLQQLGNIVPELYNAAFNRYQAEGNDLYNRMGIIQNLDSTDYGRYRDMVSDYYNNLNYYGNKENTLYNRDYTLGRDEVSDSQWERQFTEQQRQNQISNEQWQKNYDLQQKAAAAEAEKDRLAAAEASKEALRKEMLTIVQKKASDYSTPEEAKSYLENMVNNGYISPDDAVYIYQVQVGGGSAGSSQDGYVPVTRDELLEKIGRDKSVLTEAQFNQEKAQGKGGKYSLTLGSKNYYEYLAKMYEMYMG